VSETRPHSAEVTPWKSPSLGDVDNDGDEPTVRRATAADLAILRDLYRRSSLSNENDRDALLGAPDALIWPGDGIASGRTELAVDGSGQVLGFATTVVCGEGLELEDLFVDPGAMRRGVGTRLVSALVAQAASDGVPWVEVTANPHAAAFYASVGFAAVGTVETRFGPAPRLRRTVGR
jgi:GNAT superfamily N-acetyltransferase